MRRCPQDSEIRFDRSVGAAIMSMMRGVRAEVAYYCAPSHQDIKAPERVALIRSRFAVLVIPVVKSKMRRRNPMANSHWGGRTWVYKRSKN